ncbi:unnamed protein product, partial [Merluccius merluccius]
EQKESELHVGISNSEGVVFSYTESGVQRQQHGWEQSLTIPLVTPSNHPFPPLLPDSIVRSWDQHLETFSSQERWTADRVSQSSVLSVGSMSWAAGWRMLPSASPPPSVTDTIPPVASSSLLDRITHTGVVYNYTRQGVMREQTGWEQSIRVVLVQRDSFSLRDQWDKYLETYSAGTLWDPAWTRFDEVTHNCYSYCLGFINRVLEVEGRVPLTREQFTERYVLPRTTTAARYTGLLQ